MVPAVLFLYFACLAPAVSFGTISSEITNGSMGVVEFLLGSGVAGMVSLKYFVNRSSKLIYIIQTHSLLCTISKHAYSSTQFCVGSQWLSWRPLGSHLHLYLVCFDFVH